MCRKLMLAATAIGLVLAVPALASAKDKPAKAAAAPAQAAPQPGAPAPPRKATPEERADAERLDPLSRAAFWAHEVGVDPRDADAGVKLSAALRALGRFPEASDAAQQVLVLYPDNAAALMESARDAIAAGRGFYAIDPLKKLQAKDARDWRTWSLLGIAYEQTERYDEAMAAWNQALALSPDNPAVLTNLAMHYAAKGDAGQAESLLRKAVAQPGSTVQERQNLALVLGLEGKFAEAEQITRQDLPPDQAGSNLAYLRAAYASEAETAPTLRPAKTATN